MPPRPEPLRETTLVAEEVRGEAISGRYIVFYPKDTVHMRHRLQMPKQGKSPLREAPLVRLFCLPI